jgi:hypothetical protein
MVKNLSDEVFNAGKDIEAMKRLTLHRIASLLHRFCCPALIQAYMGMFVETTIANQGKQTSVSCFHFEGTNGSLLFLFSVCSKQQKLSFSSRSSLWN